MFPLLFVEQKININVNNHILLFKKHRFSKSENSKIQKVSFFWSFSSFQHKPSICSIHFPSPNVQPLMLVVHWDPRSNEQRANVLKRDEKSVNIPRNLSHQKVNWKRSSGSPKMKNPVTFWIPSIIWMSKWETFKTLYDISYWFIPGSLEWRIAILIL